jgi:hypothetical protein
MLRLHNVIFCDDIRNEINNKLSLIGMYDDRIIFRSHDAKKIKWPIPQPLAILLRFNLKAEDEHPDRFIFEYILNEKSIAKINGTINKIEKLHASFNLSLRGQGIPLAPGNLGFRIELFNGEKLLLSEDNEQALKIMQE